MWLRYSFPDFRVRVGDKAASSGPNRKPFNGAAGREAWIVDGLDDRRSAAQLERFCALGRGYSINFTID
jgi:hypothetical protein